MNKIELLAPAGSFEKAKVAFMYGADAVYAGTSSLSLRTRAAMENSDLAETIKYAHSIGKKVYTNINIYAWDEKYEEIKEQAKMLNELKVTETTKALFLVRAQEEIKNINKKQKTFILTSYIIDFKLINA